MSPLAQRTAAVVVVYRNDSDPSALIAQLRPQVGLTIVADNTAEGHPALGQFTAQPDVLRIHNANRGALAGAYNQALRLLQERQAHRPGGVLGPATGANRILPGGFTHVVFLDEDSDVCALTPFLDDAEVLATLERTDTAAVAPAYRDRATGLRGKYIELTRWRLRYLPRDFAGLRQVAFVINSMSVWRLDALARIGHFNQGLAVDHVDTEACLRARAAGLRVWVHGSHTFAHSIGQRRAFTLFGRQMQAGGHSADRRRMIGRNTAWLGRRYFWREPAFAALCLMRLGYETAGILLAEDQRWRKLAALWRGVAAGLLSLTLA